MREPTAEDPSDSEGESEDDMVSDNEDNNKEEADKSSGAKSKHKRQKSKKKNMKLVSPLAFFASSHYIVLISFAETVRATHILSEETGHHY